MVGVNTENFRPLPIGGGSEIDAMLAMAPLAGALVSNFATSEVTQTFSVPQKQWRLFPYFPAKSFAIDQIGISVTVAAGPASQMQVILYDADPVTGRPTNPIGQSPIIGTNVTGTLLVPFAHNFMAGKLYWLGHKAVQPPTIRFIGVGASRVLGVTSGAAAAPQMSLIRNRLITDPLDPWPYANSQLSTGAPTLIVMRVA